MRILAILLLTYAILVHSQMLMNNMPILKENNAVLPSFIVENYISAPNCIHTVNDQGRCTGWAMVASQVLADRYCLKGINVDLSAQDILSCLIHTCADVQETYTVWKYLESNGVVKESCFPYTSWTAFNFPCKETCVKNEEPWVKYSCAKGSLVHIINQKADDIMQEIKMNGPVMAQMNVYLDFIYHKKGIYTHKEGKYLGRHTVRIYGYGSENGINYWQCANTWSYNWGEEGIFKIKMGECAIESDIWACSPDKPHMKTYADNNFIDEM